MFISLKYILRSKIRSSKIKIKIRGSKIQIRRKIKIHGSKIKIRGSKIKISWKIKIDDSKKDKKIAGSFLWSAGRPTCPANVLSGLESKSDFTICQSLRHYTAWVRSDFLLKSVNAF